MTTGARTAWSPLLSGPATLALGTALAVVTVLAWVATIRGASAMTMAMPGMSPSLSEGAAFTVQWGVMMAAMMLPSAAPMILLYRTVATRLSTSGERSIPAAVFAAVYLVLWLATGIPVYAGYLAAGAASRAWPWFAATSPYLVAAIIAAAGVYQLTAAKRACLRKCESPLGFLMERWRGGYGPTLRLAAVHTGFCIGCCWGLMLILVAAGAMSLPWVGAIALVVFVEKVLPRGGRTARLVGVALLALAAAVALRPELARQMRGETSESMARAEPAA